MPEHQHPRGKEYYGNFMALLEFTEMGQNRSSKTRPPQCQIPAPGSTFLVLGQVYFAPLVWMSLKSQERYVMVPSTRILNYSPNSSSNPSPSLRRAQPWTPLVSPAGNAHQRAIRHHSPTGSLRGEQASSYGD